MNMLNCQIWDCIFVQMCVLPAGKKQNFHRFEEVGAPVLLYQSWWALFLLQFNILWRSSLSPYCSQLSKFSCHYSGAKPLAHPAHISDSSCFQWWWSHPYSTVHCGQSATWLSVCPAETSKNEPNLNFCCLLKKSWCSESKFFCS